jgi:hypothetical protein
MYELRSKNGGVEGGKTGFEQEAQDVQARREDRIGINA